MINQFKERASIQNLSRWIGMPRSTFYYRPHPGPRGMKASTETLYKGALVSNDVVINDIRKLITGPYNAYGYFNINEDLRDLGYLINKKKTYRLMDENHLLLGKVIRCSGKRKWVQHRKILSTKPMEYLCLDIKYVWVQGEGRWYYLLSIMDVFSRKILHWIFQRSVRKTDVVNMFRWIHECYDLKGVIIRNDNGSQFLANQVRNFLREMEAQQEFTHIATPEENAYIEAFHSILQRELIERFEFSSFYEAKLHIEQYMQWYNYDRKHRNLGRITPHQKWKEGLSCSADKQRGHVDAEGMSRPDDSMKNQTTNHPLVISLDIHGAATYFCLSAEQENRNTSLFKN